MQIFDDFCFPSHYTLKTMLNNIEIYIVRWKRVLQVSTDEILKLISYNPSPSGLKNHYYSAIRSRTFYRTL